VTVNPIKHLLATAPLLKPDDAPLHLRLARLAPPAQRSRQSRKWFVEKLIAIEFSSRGILRASGLKVGSSCRFPREAAPFPT
jgi:hypothetical protein